MTRKTPLWRRLLGLHLPVLLIVAFALAPYIWMGISSITPETDLYTEVFRYFPKKPTFENYPKIFQKIAFARNLRDRLPPPCWSDCPSA